MGYTPRAWDPSSLVMATSYVDGSGSSSGNATGDDRNSLVQHKFCKTYHILHNRDSRAKYKCLLTIANVTELLRAVRK